MEWHSAAAGLAATVTDPDSRWRTPVASIPRHELIPRWWERGPGGTWALKDGAADPEAWEQAAYSNLSKITRVGPLHADRSEPGEAPEGGPTSSATLPSLVVRMLRHGRLHEGMDILDVGTGSGYSAALLAHRFGSARITSVDVDPYLTEAAAERLEGMGLHPAIVTADATGPLPGRFDRIVSMVSVNPLPASWLAALRPGGRLVTVISRTSMIVTAWKTEDGGAAGTTARDWAGFMNTRHGPDYPPGVVSRFADRIDQDGEEISTGRYPVLDVDEAWEVRSTLELRAPGTECAYREDESGLRTAWLVHPDGSWARASGGKGRPPTVHQSGPRRLWDVLDRIRNRLNTMGGLPVYGVPLTITPEGTIHLSRGRWKATIR
ncbi:MULTISPECIES: methyltransferase domain-containing protein [Streptomyces]|uniref:Protein-L-isoaspartate O-methyltransferase n=2 Tax=Streptomyces rimosus subsp. rimosus TaxID=132474 RepID=L8EVD6_STRR1|nr:MULTISPECIES: methyltransferase domain-containing protein [Streptomyces]KOG84194.1 protein-L-isoaspartate(D-aspartate) O-methyltransferase [Kitasatospora aureofaciens]MYT44872.1 methyltransferase domain-containing protein [Streptomyces sp. SID5471]KEF07570.1 protein-L-isoaspartate(D-aspartate) O-methyltransferase [Streptomyces rimosus]KEF20403.1 protein-L-isoaspartate(D-aspartate) O-methyltransferase [Streptomyces rimosus]KOT27922.1 protein-L-isoaspartate(D-aspartate) O-methyltransferase [S